MSELDDIRARHEAGDRGIAVNDREWLLAERIARAVLRRERIATAALHGLLANHHQDTFPPDTVRIAVKYADALIAELDKEGER